MDAANGAFALLGIEKDPKGEGQLRRLVERGIPQASAERLIEGLPKDQRSGWRSLLSGGAKGNLTFEGSERAARLAYLLALANDVFGSKASAYRFLTKPHPLLDDTAPLQAAQTEWGGRSVEELLRKIQFGLPV